LNRGDVLYDPNFEFRDGGHANKLFVVLSDPAKSDKVLFVKTTSSPKNRSTEDGCQPKRREFFIKSGKIFPKDTWIVLSSMPYVYPVSAVEKSILEQKRIVKSTIPDQIVNAIRNCLEKFSVDLNREARELLK